MPTRIYVAVLIAATCGATLATTQEGDPTMPSETFTLTREGQPVATIVTAAEPSRPARLSALEIQTHVWRISGAVLPIVDDGAEVGGPRILVGESEATRALGLTSDSFEPQEYLIQFAGDDLILIGRDWPGPRDSPQARGVTTHLVLADGYSMTIDYGEVTGASAIGDGTDRTGVSLPNLFDDQGTCYATYDFLERFCRVRWYGPSLINMVYPSAATVSVTPRDIRRSPAFDHRYIIGNAAGVWPLNQGLWDSPNAGALRLYAHRMREIGEPWAGNHSFVSFRDRFLKPEDAAKRGGQAHRPELFEAERPEFMAKGAGGGEGQFCYTSQALIEQVAQDARDFFDGKGTKGVAPAMGDYFAVVPLDNSQWCQCDNCKAAIAASQRQHSPHFSNGRASNYIFGFINAIAREVGKTHPDKYVQALAYWDYASLPDGVQLEPNVSVAPCLQTRIYWAPNIKRNDIETFYKPWAALADERPIHLWLYWCFPEENGLGGKFNCFPGFHVHEAAENLKMYHRDGIRGVFFCGYGEQVDCYVAAKLLDDPSLDVDDILDEFFSRYYGSAGGAMQRLYSRIEEIYASTNSYPAEVATEERQFHQNEEIAWAYLGNEANMTALAKLMSEAVADARTDTEKRRVELFETGVWQRMVAGREAWLTKQGS